MVKVCQKRKFYTRTGAYYEGVRLKTEGKIYAHEILHQYYCKECLAWHNSKKSQNEYARMYNKSKLERIEELLKEKINH